MVRIKRYQQRRNKIYSGEKAQLAEKLFRIITIITLMKQKPYYQQIIFWGNKNRKKPYSESTIYI